MRWPKHGKIKCGLVKSAHSATARRALPSQSDTIEREPLVIGIMRCVSAGDVDFASGGDIASIRGGGVIGSRTLNRLPSPSWLLTVILPPCKSTTILTR